ncbi:MAG: ATP-binding cassette domain-containing protein [Alphaproteobacteria bacterium]|nr:ATP-binding cassette domain-containing protein [Alphaproteobacteria bacterium]
MSSIRVRGARDNNLRDVDLDLPLGALTVLCGPSGSGKSSLAYDTLHREGQRRYLEALMIAGTGSLRRPDVEAIDHLPPTIALDQRVRGFASHESVASVSELGVGLAVLYGRTGLQRCPRCGRPVVPKSHDTIVAELLAMPVGTRLTLEAPVTSGPGVLEEIQRAGFSRVRVDGRMARIEEIGAVPEGAPLRVVVDRIKIEPDRRGRIHDGVRLASRAGRGVVIAVTEAETVFVDRPLCVHDGMELPALEPGRFRFRAGEPGLGLDEAAAAVEVGGERVLDVLGGTIGALDGFLAGLPASEVAKDLLDDLRRRVGILVSLGLAGLPLERPAEHVSRGELLRLRLARQVSSRVSGVLFVLDEPAAGLDDEAAGAVLGLVRDLVEQGNTVVAVDHHPVVLAGADHVVEFGPGAGPHGGTVVYAGPVAGLAEQDTATGRLFAGRLEGGVEGPTSGEALDLAGRRLVRGVVNVVSGPSGSGKTVLLKSIVDAASGRFERLVDAEVGSSAKHKRSSPATFTGVWSLLRDLLAQTREARIQGFDAGTFSLNTKGGRCETCQGAGEVRVVLDPLPDVWLTCDVCHGRRFQTDVLQVRWKGLAPDELLALDIEEAHRVLAGNPKLERILRALRDVGLGYVQLGRPADTLSGGEFRRLRLARELARSTGPDLVVADDPSLGLHPVDTLALMKAFGRLAEAGATVVLASGDPWVVGAAAHAVRLADPRP